MATDVDAQKTGLYNPANVAITGGTVKVNDGTAAAPSYSFAADTNTGFYSLGADQIGGAIGGAQVFRFTANDFRIESNSGALYMGSAGDVILARDAANTLAQRNGTAAQAFRAYNTFTDGANGEWLESSWAGNAATISVKNNGTGVARNLTVKGGSVLYLGAGAGTPVEVGSGYATIAGLTSAGAPIAAAANQIGLGGTTATTVGAAGAAAALPANPVGYININVAGTAMKIPYYNA